MDLFRKKKFGSEIEKNGLIRHLNGMDLVFLGIGSMIGTGIFTLTGTAAATVAGPALMVSILIAAIAVGISALIFAEFASRIPSQGGPYGYLYAIFGEFPAWITGVLLISEFFTALAITANGWGAYIKGLFHFRLPELINGPLGAYNHFSIDLIPILVVVGISALGFLGTQTVMRFNRILVVIKIVALALFIIAGLFFLNLDNWSNFAPFGWTSAFSGQGVMAGASLMFMAFLGFDTVSVSADETKNPNRAVPYGIFGALAVTMLLYIFVTIALTGMVNYTKLDVSDVLAFALRSVGLAWFGNIISVIAMLTLITVGITMTYALVQTIYGISRDDLLPRKLSRLSGKAKIPRNTLILSGLLSVIISGTVSIEALSSFLNLCTLLYLLMLALGILKLRRDFGQPQKGEFRAPFVPFLPLCSIGIILALIVNYSAVTWLALVILLLVATGFYFAYGYQHSRLRSKRKS